MRQIIRRLERGERCWIAEIALRSLGLLLLGLCAALTLWLYRAVHQPPPHQYDASEIVAALIAVPSFSFGGLLLIEGSNLFRLVDLPARHRRYPSTSRDLLP